MGSPGWGGRSGVPDESHHKPRTHKVGNGRHTRTFGFITIAYGRERAQEGRAKASSGQRGQKLRQQHTRKNNEGRGERRRREQVGDRGGGGKHHSMNGCDYGVCRVHYGKSATLRSWYYGSSRDII